MLRADTTLAELQWTTSHNLLCSCRRSGIVCTHTVGACCFVLHTKAEGLATGFAEFIFTHRLNDFSHQLLVGVIVLITSRPNGSRVHTQEFCDL